MRAAVRTLVIAAAFLLTGCYTHNFPVDTMFARASYRPPSLNLFVDKDGSFFPDGWRTCVVAGKRWPQRSLLGMAAASAPADRPDCGGPAFANHLASEQAKRLGEVSALASDADRAWKSNEAATPGNPNGRVFIFIHGFNNSQAEADEGYGILERGIVFRPGDALIRFYWDGYVAKGGLNPSPLGFWFKAVKNSQLAGLYGLRPVLIALGPTRQVIVITHSRGASVLLSALSNPPFASRFVKAWSGPRLDPAEPAETTLPKIRAVMLAPAIGHLDFCKQGRLGASTDVTCDDRLESLRDLPGLTSLQFTLNVADPILRKGYRAWSTRLYPTTLGYDGGDLVQLRKRYPGILVSREVAVAHGHGFPCYASDPVIRTMMSDIDVGWVQPAVPTVAQRKACVKNAAR